MRKIIMVCTGNTCRSPMAEALMKQALGQRGITHVAVRSAGTCARSGDPASFEAVIEMQTRGLNIGGHRSERLDRMDVRDALLLCMADGHVREALRMHPDADVHQLARYAGLQADIKDPIGQGEAAYRQAADHMKKAIDIIAEGVAKSKGR